MRTVLTAALIAAAVHAAVWFGVERVRHPADLHGPIDHVSYSPYMPGHDPKDHVRVTAEQIEADLAALSEVVRGVRTYSTIDGIDQVPAVAEQFGLNVALGAWVGDTPERTASELDAVVQLAKAHRNVRSVLVGNEVLFRDEMTPDELIALIKDVKRQVRVPVSTGELYEYWLKYPKLVNAVDFIAVHILPYWDGIPSDQVIPYTFERLDLLRKTYPGKRIVIAEFGWPSQGYNRQAADPGRLAQADIIRGFIAEAERRGIEYNIVEAFDQTWKDEGGVGAYWGMFDAGRELKFPFAGPVENGSIPWKAGAALLFGLALTVAGLRLRRPTLAHAMLFAFAANAMAGGIALALAYPFENYLNWGVWIMWSVGVLAIVPLTAITLTKVHEIGEVLLGRRPRRLIDVARACQSSLPSLPPAAFSHQPKVSIHIPAYREPAAMVIETLNSIAALDYENYEAIVIVNNTPEADYSAPVAARCRELGDRFKFLDITCKGFKAGALNVAIEHTAPDAEFIAVLDADYAVERGWLKDLMPYFADPAVGLVQAPQDHRDGAETPLKQMMNAEYAGFFDIGMVQRNEDDAIIQHGTMCIVRRSALDHVGGWGTDTIVEDTDLGLRLYEAGYQAHYTNHRYGKGLLPDTYKAFKTQRFRWAYGAMQLIRKHWQHMLPGARTLKPAQKVQFLTGWSLWLSDALGSLVSVFNLLWVPVVILVGVVIPTMPFTVPILAAFAVNLLHCVLLYAKRVDAPWWQIPGAAVAAMSLQLTVARAVLFGLLKDRLPFLRTEKGGNGRRTAENPAFWETILGLALLGSALLLMALNHTQIIEMQIFAWTLIVQSVPFLAATVMMLVERAQGWPLWRRFRAARPAPAGVTAGANAA